MQLKKPMLSVCVCLREKKSVKEGQREVDLLIIFFLCIGIFIDIKYTLHLGYALRPPCKAVTFGLNGVNMCSASMVISKNTF